jgi:hypothetical protein
MVNAKYLKLFEPSILDEEEEPQVLPSIEEFTPHTLEYLKENLVLQCKERVTHRGLHEMWKICLKGQISRKEMW